MPANLTPQYHEAEARYKAASTPAQKLEALEEMLRVIPKHKGTEKMQADIKRRMSSLRRESSKKKGPVTQKPFWQIDSEGAGQVLLCGAPNSGKSQFVLSLTGVEAEVADYPFTTRLPQPAMMPFEDVQIQLIDTPPLAPEVLEPWQITIMQRADTVLLIFDVFDPALLDQTEFVLSLLKEKGFSLSGKDRPRFLVLGNKTDRPDGPENFSAWQELYENRFCAVPVSALDQESLERVRRTVFESLDVVRVYTKAPGEKTEQRSAPFVLPRGSTILDAAAAVHKDLEENFRFARVWGHTKFDGQMVERSYPVEDGDLVEIHG